MPIECDCCGKVIDKYDMVRYNREWLENYLEDYFKLPISDLRTNGTHRHKRTIFRDVCIYVFRTYGKLTVIEIEDRYGLNHSKLGEWLTSMDKSHHDFIFIDKELSSQLPEAQKLITPMNKPNDRTNGHGH